MTSRWRSTLARILRSPLLAAALGLLAAQTYWSLAGEKNVELVPLLVRIPQSQASQLAFRFGSAEHARGTLLDLARLPSAIKLDGADEMSIELQLAALEGEHDPSSTSSLHLQRAAAACERYHSKRCPLPTLKSFAAKLATGRRQ